MTHILLLFTVKCIECIKCIYNTVMTTENIHRTHKHNAGTTTTVKQCQMFSIVNREHAVGCVYSAEKNLAYYKIQ